MRAWLTSLVLAPAALCLVAAMPVPPQNGYEGRWNGVILVQPGEIEVDFSLSFDRDGQGDLAGRVSFPTQGPAQYPLSIVKVNGDLIEFSNEDSSGTVARYTAVLSPDGKTIAGDVTEQGVTKPFLLQRASDRTAAGDTPRLHLVSRGGNELVERFNRDADAVRLVMILSPNCGMCKMGARMVERHILDKITDPNLRIYVLWEPVGTRDTEQAARDAMGLISGERVTHFWSPEKFTGTAFQNVAAPQKDPLWDVFLLFGEGKRWTADGPPSPDSFMHNRRESKELPKDRYLNSAKLAAEVQKLLE